MLNEKYKKFCCIKCKNEIVSSLKECSKFQLTTCDNCYIDLERMKRLLSENTSKEKKTDFTYEQLNAIDNHYFQKTGIYETIIDKQYKYTSVEALLLEIGNSIENRESELNIDRKDFIRIFKDANLIYRKVVNLSLYHYSEFENLKGMILILYTQRNRSIFKIIEQSNFFIDSLGEEVEILIDIRTVENKIQEKVEIFYNHKKI